MKCQVLWEDDAINDRLEHFEWLYGLNPTAAEDADRLIEEKVDLLETNPQLGVVNQHTGGRILVIRSLSLNVYYQENGLLVRVLRVLHQKRKQLRTRDV